MASKSDRYNIKMAALGRQIQLGELYDYQNDRIVKDSPPGWESVDLSDESVILTNEKFEFEVKVGDSDSNKWEQMGLDEHLTASTLAGLFDKYRGASNYLNDQNNTAQVTKTIVCRITLKQENLDVSALSKPKGVEFVEQKKGKSANNSEAATYVIFGVVYGAEAYCVLTQDLANETDEDAREDAKDELSDWANKMESALGEEQDLVEFKDQFETEEKQRLTKMKCRLYVDAQTPAFRECNYFDAYKHCLKLIEQTKNPDGKCVPICYTLCPLKVIMNPEGLAKFKIRNPEVDNDLLIRCCNIWVQLESIRARVTSLTTVKKINRAPLRQFITALGKYQDMIKKRLNTTVIKARNSSDDDNDDAYQELEKIVDIAEKQVIFNPSRLRKWLHFKQAEIEMIKAIMAFKGIPFLDTIDKLNEKLAESCDSKYSLILSVPALDEMTSEMLEKMKHYVTNYTKLVATKRSKDDDDDGDDEDDDDDDEDENDKPWHMIPAKKKQVLDKMREFSNYVTKNQETENENVQFFTTVSAKNRKFACQYSIYENGKMLKENCQLPSPPTGLKSVLEKSGKIRLEWSYKDVGYPHQFVVEYRPKDSENSWQQKTTKSGQMELVVNCKRGAVLEFRVAADTCIGRSDFSEIADTESALIDDICDDDRESVFSSVSQSNPMSKQSPQTQLGSKTKTKQEEISKWAETQSVTSQATNRNREDQFINLDSASQFTSSRSEMAMNQQASAAGIIRNRCQKIGNRNDMDLYAIPLTKLTGQGRNTIQRYVFDQGGQKKSQHKTILVMGATGAGKTTLINGMINYIFGVEWEDTFRFQLIEEQLVGKSQANSQTSIITAYDIHHMEGFRIPFSLTIVDTPGYGDTKGLESDQEITEMVRQFFEDKNGIQELDVIGFVAQAFLPRLSATQTYIFDSIFSIFGNDVKENINFLLPFADSQLPPVLSAISAANLPCPTDAMTGKPLHHKFNNSGFFCSNKESSTANTRDQFNRFYWRMGIDNFQKFFAILATMKTKSLSLTKQVLEERKKLEATVDGLQPLIKFGLAKMEEMRQKQMMITNSQAQMDANENVEFETEVEMPKMVEIPNGQFLTNCNKCHITCHNPCAYQNDDDKVMCWAMDHSMPKATRSCTICPQKCIWNIHANQPYKWEYVKETQKTSSDAIKQKYEKEQNKKLSTQEVIKCLQKEIDDNEKVVLQRVSTVAKSLQRLDEIALRPNPFSTTQYIDLIIESELQDKKSGFKERIESLKKLRQAAEVTNKVRNNVSLFDC